MGSTCTTTSSYYERYKYNMKKTPPPPPLRCTFHGQVDYQDKTTPPSANTTLQIGKYVTYIESKGACLPEIITMVTVDTSSG